MSACSVDTRLEPRVTNPTTFNLWREATSESINQLKSSAATKNNVLSAGELLQMESLQKDIYNTLACLQEKHSASSNLSNGIYDAQTRILQLNEQIQAKEQDIAIAKDRVAYIRDPDAHTSYYQSWFPMDRPMRPSSIPILLGITVFMAIFLFFAVISLLGVNVSYVPTPNSFVLYALLWLRAQMTPFFFLALALLIGAVLYYRRRTA